MAFEFKFIKRVEFAETDAAGILHFSNYFRYMEMTEHAFFRSLGLSIYAGNPVPEIGWPRVHVECHYKEPLRFEDGVEIHLLIKEIKKKSITYKFIFRKIASGRPSTEIAWGRVTAVCINFDEHGRIAGATAIPSEIAGRIEKAPQELLS
jgi:YbgC/YbaW family acyl-CoA thioester hydrolase